MNNYQNLFITENSSINEYNDYELNKENIEYYNLIVEDDFGKQSLSNVVSTSIISMPRFSTMVEVDLECILSIISCLFIFQNIFSFKQGDCL